LKLKAADVSSTGRHLVASSLAFLAIACGPPARPLDVLVYASGTDLESANPLVTIHPLSRQIQRYVLLVTLAKYDSVLSPQPYAAREWSWSADRRDLTFRLVASLRWHDGAAFRAGDVAFTLLAARDPKTGYARSADLAGLDTVIAVNDTTVTLRFHSPQSAFPLVLCELPIVPAHLLASVPRADLRRATYNMNPVGDGPFKFAERRSGQLWRFVRNPDFPAEMGGPPKLGGIVVAVVDEATTKFAGLASGDLDVAGIAPTMASLVRKDPSLRVLEYPVLFTTGIVLNTHRPPFDDVRVRRAVDLSLDRTRIIDVALAGFGTPAFGPVPPENPLASPMTRPRNLAAADSLLDLAGWRRAGRGVRTRDGKPLTFELLTVGSSDNAIEQLIQGDLAARGMEMRIRQVEGGAFLTEARAMPKRFDALIAGVSGDLMLSYVAAMFDATQRGSSLDYADFHFPALSAAFAQTRQARTDPGRRDAWITVQRLLADSMPVVWVYHSRGLQGVSARLAGVRMDLRGELASIADWTAIGPPGTRPR
jgi:peptide/nickel transport system substrate-binding protein